MTNEEAQRRLIGQYRAARAVWRKHPHVRRVAEQLGITEREYCDRFVGMFCDPISWTGVVMDNYHLNCDKAYRDALLEVVQ